MIELVPNRDWLVLDLFGAKFLTLGVLDYGECVSVSVGSVMFVSPSSPSFAWQGELCPLPIYTNVVLIIIFYSVY